MKKFIFLTSFISFEKVFFKFKYSTGKSLINNLFNFIILNKENISVNYIT